MEIKVAHHEKEPNLIFEGCVVNTLNLFCHVVLCESFCKNLMDNKQELKTWEKLSMLSK